MNKKELKKRIEDGFEELAPDISEAIMKAAEERGLVLLQEKSCGQNARIKEEDSGHKKRNTFSFGKSFMGRFPKYALSMCAVLALACLCVYGGFGGDRDMAYMVVDINPSIRIEMDASCQVERLKGLDQEGKEVVGQLAWKEREPVGDLMDALIEEVVEETYLKENSGILITLFASDESVCKNLEDTVEKRIGKKLKQLGMSGITVATRRAEVSSDLEGRKILEEELVRTCGLTEEKARQMPVAELIKSCQESSLLQLKVSPPLKEKEKEPSEQNAENGKRETSPDGTLPEKNGQKRPDHYVKEEDESQSAGKETPKEKEAGQDAGNPNKNKGAQAPAQEPVPAQQEMPGEQIPQAEETPVGEQNSGANPDAQAPAEASAPSQQETPVIQVPITPDSSKDKKSEKKKKEKNKKKKEKKEKEKEKKEKEKEKKEKEKEDKEQKKKENDKKKEENQSTEQKKNNGSEKEKKENGTENNGNGKGQNSGSGTGASKEKKSSE